MSLKTLTMSAITRLPELAALKSEPYESRGILHSEIAAILALAKELRIELCIESAHGVLPDALRDKRNDRRQRQHGRAQGGQQ